MKYKWFDWELYKRYVKRKRGWNKVKSRTEWRKHMTNKEISKSTEEVDGKKQLVMRVPVGREDLEDDVREEAEELRRGGKQEKNVSAEDAAELRKRLVGDLKLASGSGACSSGAATANMGATSIPAKKKTTYFLFLFSLPTLHFK